MEWGENWKERKNRFYLSSYSLSNFLLTTAEIGFGHPAAPAICSEKEEIGEKDV